MNKWTLGVVLACLALSVNWADAQGAPPAANPVLVLDLGVATTKCEEQTDIIEAVERKAVIGVGAPS